MFNELRACLNNDFFDPSRAARYSNMGSSVMKCIAVSVALQILLTAAATSRDMIREVPFVEQARPGMAYDYIVHVRNVPAIRYNPLVQEDRDRMALVALKSYCRTGRVIEDQKINTEIWGITSSYPDYLVLIACRK